MNNFRSSFSDLIHQYINYRIASGNWNESNYGYCLRKFDNYCADNYPSGSGLNQEMVDTWCAKKGKELNRSRNTRIRVVRSFIEYLRSRGLTNVESPPLLKNEPMTYIPHAFTTDELKNFFRECDNIVMSKHSLASQLTKLTCPVLFRLLYSSGIRTTEARLLKRKNVDFINGIIDIQESKGYDQHYVALHPSMTDILRKYDRAVDRIIPSRVYFFQSAKGSVFNHQWLEAQFRKIWKKANGSDSKAVAYELRHHYAITNINSWNNDSFEFSDKLNYLAKSMGHRWTSSTLYYYSIVPRLSETIRDKTEEGFNEIIPEVSYEEE